MVSTHSVYKRSGQELLPGLERSRASRMSGEHYEGEEEEDPRVRLDRFEQSLATLTLMVSQLLAAKSKEIPSTKTCHEGPKKEENKPETECKTEPKMGECSYNKTQVYFRKVPFRVEAKVDIKPYVEEVDAIRMNQWLQ
jgi:hypothetical protein